MVQVGRPERSDPPPILTLLDLFEEHRSAFEYDWRTRFHIAHDVPTNMSWGEAWRLTKELALDPSSHVSAAIGGWAFPVSREWIVAADHYDAFVASQSRRDPKPYPRPWDKKPHAVGAGTSMTVTEYRALRASVEA